MSQKIILASGNAGKLREFHQLLADCGFDVIPQSAYQIDNADETGLTFVENAIIKARHACQHTGLPAIADDSGLEVDALNGRPGIYSARYAGTQASDSANNTKLLQELNDVMEASAPRVTTACWHLCGMRKIPRRFFAMVFGKGASSVRRAGRVVLVMIPYSLSQPTAALRLSWIKLKKIASVIAGLPWHNCWPH